MPWKGRMRIEGRCIFDLCDPHRLRVAACASAARGRQSEVRSRETTRTHDQKILIKLVCYHFVSKESRNKQQLLRRNVFDVSRAYFVASRIKDLCSRSV